MGIKAYIGEAGCRTAVDDGSLIQELIYFAFHFLCFLNGESFAFVRLVSVGIAVEQLKEYEMGRGKGEDKASG